MLNMNGVHKPFKINTLNNESTRKTLQETILYKKHASKSHLRHKIEDLKVKNDLIDEYKNTYGLKVKDKELVHLLKHVEPIGLEIILKKKLSEMKENVSAAKIQANFRGSLCRVWFKKMHRIRTIAARRIQRCWKLYHHEVIRPRNLAKKN